MPPKKKKINKKCKSNLQKKFCAGKVQKSVGGGGVKTVKSFVCVSFPLYSTFSPGLLRHIAYSAIFLQSEWSEPPPTPPPQTQPAHISLVFYFSENPPHAQTALSLPTPLSLPRVSPLCLSLSARHVSHCAEPSAAGPNKSSETPETSR